MLVVAGYGFRYGDPPRLLYPIDSNGSICNLVTDGMDMSGKPFLYYPLPTTLQYRCCVKACPTSSGETVGKLCELFTGSSLDASSFGISSIPADTLPTYASSSVFLHCVPDKSAELLGSALTSKFIPISSDMRSWQNSLKRYQSDVYNAWVPEVVMGLVAPIVLGFVWLLLVRYFAGPMVWLTIVAMLVTLAAITILFFFKAGMITDDQLGPAKDLVNSDYLVTSDHRDAMKICAYIMCAIDVVALLLVLVLFRQVRIAVAIIKEASDAVRTMPSVILFPLVTLLLLTALWVYWILVFAFLASAGTYDKATKSFNYDSVLQGCIVYHLFGLLWTYQFIVAIGLTTLAGAFAAYYFTSDKKAVEQLAVWSSFGRVFRYHLGSLAFGSLLIAIIQLIRAIMAYLHRQAQLAQNQIAQFIFGAIQYCLLCFERFLQFLNKNAFIMIAIYGKSFCASAGNAAKLLLSNILRLAAISVISDFLLFLGKIAITASCTSLAFVWMSQDPRYTTGTAKLNSVILPLVVVFLGSYTIATAFISVFDIAIDTIFLCFCADSAKAPPGLVQFLDESAEEAKRKKK
eukprot:CAMPEP_0184672956 /NCGR_PEP_ID=MMETSP0308-20130426/86409_1 /TAXON_ID=38269 /ORGANISM="Gloeochaete witrockiana, Strain SAG 46.84" /LENGTH=573 /DNA_ID=CAMNT_0027120383 /DNA_START=56 /DNA_END=1777 /DNA_ORIENTATION=-